MKRPEAYIMPAGSRPAPGDAAPGVPTSDAQAVNRPSERQLYAARKKVYPKLASGRYRTLKWAVMVATLAIYYGLPWLRWNRGPDLPDQAVLLDMANNRFFFFFLEIWPQEFYFVTGLLVLAALVLFFVTSLAGRVWCGYTCPQTVWTDLMVTIERFWQGDRNARIRLDQSPWGPGKIFRKAMTHLSWLAVGVLTGGALVFYFRDAPMLARELLTGTAPMIAYLFLGIFALTTYVLGGIAREQVCIYMCPWPRIQGAMVDHETLLVSYQTQRGEPRGPHKKGQSWEGRGDCIDCRACVAVCPTGIDIRDGAQLECIQCALCVDACNGIMDRIGRPRGLVGYSTITQQDAAACGKTAPLHLFRPRGLVGYSTITQQEAAACGKTAPLHLFRPRTLLYLALLALVSSIMLVAWLRRTVLEINVLHDRNPPFVHLSDGGIRNGYTVKILNKLHEPRNYSLIVKGLGNTRLTVVGLEHEATPQIRVATDDLRELRVLVTVPRDGVAALGRAQTPFDLVIRDLESGQETLRRVNFQRQ